MSLRDFAGLVPNVAVSDETAFDAGTWVDEARAALEEAGAVVVRGPISRVDAAEKALQHFDDELLDDAFWSTPRSKVQGKTLTATEYPSPRTIPLHSEMAYMRSWPRFVAFHSLVVADEGGETTMCSVDAVSKELGETLKPFQQKGVTYRRVFQKGVDVAWRQAFQTDERRDVEAMGRRLGMEVKWLPNDVLVTSHTAQGTVASEDGSTLLFNQAHLFHASALEPAARTALEALGDRMPRQAFFGDGAVIPDATLDQVRGALDRNMTKMCWREGDVLIFDNMRFLHGRLPFKGSRKLHVALARLHSSPVRTPIFAPQPQATSAPEKKGLLQRIFTRA
jgi:hypothetical protein